MRLRASFSRKGRATCRRTAAPSLATSVGPAALVVLAVMFAAPEARAYCRTTTVPPPSSYDSSRGCYEEGLPVFWRNACVGFSINSAGSAKLPPADTERAIRLGFAAWGESICPDSGAALGLSIVELGSSTCSEVRFNERGPNQNVVVFRDDVWPYGDPGSTLGLTTVTFNAHDGEIFDVDLEINSSGDNLSVDEQVPIEGYDLLSVVTHEAGHFIGLAHSSDASATMFASYRPGSSAQRSLAPDDVLGACAIYPDAATRLVATSVDPSGAIPASACDPTPLFGFGSTCESNPAPVEEKDAGGCVVGPTGAPRSSGSLVAVGALLAMALTRRVRRSG